MLLDPARLARLAKRAAGAGVRAGKVPARAVWHRAVLARGSDISAASAGRRCLVVAPHPDDETIGCGATIAAKRAAGTDVAVAIVTDGRHGQVSAEIPALRLARLRAEESRAACALLGVAADRVAFLGFEELTLWRCLDDVAEAIAALIEHHQPDEVLVTCAADWHDDHQAVNLAVRLAALRCGFAGRLAAYPVWFWADGPWRTPPYLGPASVAGSLWRDPLDARHLPAAELVSTAGRVDLKRAAFACYRSQTTNLTGEATWATFPTDWLDPFVGPWEVFFPIGADAVAAAPAEAAGAATTASVGNGAPNVVPAAAASAYLDAVRDDFVDDRQAGSVIGTAATSGPPRLGIDTERTIAIDNSELRLATLADPGYGRQAIAYGPFRRTPGLTLAVQVLNSHNTAQSNILAEGRKDLLRRLVRQFPNGRIVQPHLDDNLAVGFLPEPAPREPRGRGNAFVMHAASTVNGELRARVGGGMLRAFQGIQEVPLTYLVSLDESGATYYVSSLAGAEGTAPFPAMRPVAVDAQANDPELYAVITQAVHGEVGHELSSRVAAVRVAVVNSLASANRGRLAGDDLVGEGPLAASPTALGRARWRVPEGAVARGPQGAVGDESVGGVALIDPGEPAGLVHVGVTTAAVFAPRGRVGLWWRCGASGAWRVTLTADRGELSIRLGDGPWETVAEGPVRLEAATRCSLQVVDDGIQFGVHLDGALLFDRWFDDERLASQSGVGFTTGPGSCSTVDAFQVHPRTLAIPTELELEGPWQRQGDEQPAVTDEFAGPAGPLDGRWSATLGQGRFARTGTGAAHVVASVAEPNPGRTAYTMAWDDPTFADLEVRITPPGTARGQGHNGRGGLIFQQDPETYLLVNMWLDDAPHHDGSSISMFFMSQGYERLYDACWTNVGRRVFWGRPFTLRMAFDGWQALVWLDGVPVLSRRVRDIYPTTPRVAINRVGLVANWEWGDDTGTRFERFVARRATASPSAT